MWASQPPSYRKVGKEIEESIEKYEKRKRPRMRKRNKMTERG